MNLWYAGAITLAALAITVVVFLLRAGNRPPLIHQKAVLGAFRADRALTGSDISYWINENHLTIMEERTLDSTLAYLEKVGKVEGRWIEGPGRDRIKDRLYKIKLPVEDLAGSTPPLEVQLAVGSAMKYADLLIWWSRPHRLLEEQSPKELWAAGRKDVVLDFIEAAKSGGMA